MLASAEAVLALQPMAAAEGIDVGVVGLYPPGSECAYEVRAFFSDHRGSLVEDPVTGSLNASLAQWLIERGDVVAPYTASQGTRLGRAGRPRISTDEVGSVWVAGATHTVVEGTVDID
jgi:predicted PhzF superfamily epimerase YddE/YHI9